MYQEWEVSEYEALECCMCTDLRNKHNDTAKAHSLETYLFEKARQQLFRINQVNHSILGFPTSPYQSSPPLLANSQPASPLPPRYIILSDLILTLRLVKVQTLFINCLLALTVIPRRENLLVP